MARKRKSAMREMMCDMRSVLLEDALDGELNEELGYSNTITGTKKHPSLKYTMENRSCLWSKRLNCYLHYRFINHLY